MRIANLLAVSVTMSKEFGTYTTFYRENSRPVKHQLTTNQANTITKRVVELSDYCLTGFIDGAMVNIYFL